MAIAIALTLTSAISSTIKLHVAHKVSGGVALKLQVVDRFLCGFEGTFDMISKVLRRAFEPPAHVVNSVAEGAEFAAEHLKRCIRCGDLLLHDAEERVSLMKPVF